jgi:hypothetical protein
LGTTPRGSGQRSGEWGVGSGECHSPLPTSDSISDLRFQTPEIMLQSEALPPDQGSRIPSMTNTYLLTSSFRRRAPIAFARAGVVRPGMWIFGAGSAGGRAP